MSIHGIRISAPKRVSEDSITCSNPDCERIDPPRFLARVLIDGEGTLVDAQSSLANIECAYCGESVIWGAP